jgi:hypothetical protein
MLKIKWYACPGSCSQIFFERQKKVLWLQPQLFCLKTETKCCGCNTEIHTDAHCSHSTFFVVFQRAMAAVRVGK